MKSYRSTILANIGALGAFIMFSSQSHLIHWPNWTIAIAAFMASGGLAGFGIVAKDAAVHSTVDEVTQSTALEQIAETKAEK